MTEPRDLTESVESIAALIGLPINPADRLGVVANLERIHTIAQLVIEFPLPEEIEAAPVFEP